MGLKDKLYKTYFKTFVILQIFCEILQVIEVKFQQKNKKIKIIHVYVPTDGRL